MFASYCKHCHHCNEFSRIEMHCWIEMQSVLLEFQQFVALHRIIAALLAMHSRGLHRAVLHCGTLGPAHSSTLSTGQVGSCCIASMLNSHIPPPPPLNTCCVAKMPLTALKTFQKPPKDALHCKALMLNSSYPSLSRPAMLPTCR